MNYEHPDILVNPPGLRPDVCKEMVIATAVKGKTMEPKSTQHLVRSRGGALLPIIVLAPQIAEVVKWCGCIDKTYKHTNHGFTVQATWLRRICQEHFLCFVAFGLHLKWYQDCRSWICRWLPWERKKATIGGWQQGNNKFAVYIIYSSCFTLMVQWKMGVSPILVSFLG